MKNVVTKTALKTVLIVLIALIAAFTTASLGFPQHMATMFEKMGAYSFATGYAGLAYKYKNTVDRLARCVDYSIFAEDDANIVNYGDELVARDDFKEYAEGRTAALDGEVDYFHFIYGRIACAKYISGKKDAAFETAQKSMQGVSDFPQDNAFAALAIRSVDNSDAEFSQRLLNEIKNFTPTAEQQTYYNAVIAILT